MRTRPTFLAAFIAFVACLSGCGDDIDPASGGAAGRTRRQLRYDTFGGEGGESPQTVEVDIPFDVDFGLTAAPDELTSLERALEAACAQEMVEREATLLAELGFVEECDPEALGATAAKWRDYAVYGRCVGQHLLRMAESPTPVRVFENGAGESLVSASLHAPRGDGEGFAPTHAVTGVSTEHRTTAAFLAIDHLQRAVAWTTRAMDPNVCSTADVAGHGAVLERLASNVSSALVDLQRAGEIAARGARAGAFAQRGRADTPERGVEAMVRARYGSLLESATLYAHVPLNRFDTEEHRGDFPVARSLPRNEDELRALRLLEEHGVGPRGPVDLDAVDGLLGELLDAMNERFGGLEGETYGGDVDRFLATLGLEHVHFLRAATYLRERAATFGLPLGAAPGTGPSGPAIFVRPPGEHPPHLAQYLFALTEGAAVLGVPGVGDDARESYAVRGLPHVLDLAQRRLREIRERSDLSPAARSAVEAALALAGGQVTDRARVCYRRESGDAIGRLTLTFDAVPESVPLGDGPSCEGCLPPYEVWLGEAGILCALEGQLDGRPCDEARWRVDASVNVVASTSNDLSDRRARVQVEPSDLPAVAGGRFVGQRLYYTRRAEGPGARRVPLTALTVVPQWGEATAETVRLFASTKSADDDDLARLRAFFGFESEGGESSAAPVGVVIGAGGGGDGGDGGDDGSSSGGFSGGDSFGTIGGGDDDGGDDGGSGTLVGGGATESAHYCYEIPIGPMLDEGLVAMLGMDPADPSGVTETCGGVPNDFQLPLESALSAPGAESDGVDTTMHRYLARAEQAAARADSLGQELYRLYLEDDLREEREAIRQAQIDLQLSGLAGRLEQQCGGSIDVARVLEVACGSGESCDLVGFLEELAQSDSLPSDLAYLRSDLYGVMDCLGLRGESRWVAMGNRQLCAYRDLANGAVCQCPEDEPEDCPPCPILVPVDQDAPSWCSLSRFALDDTDGLEPLPITDTLDYEATAADGERPEPDESGFVCGQVIRLRRALFDGDAASAPTPEELRWFTQANLKRVAESVGAEEHAFGFLELTLGGGGWARTGDTRGPDATWPCAPHPDLPADFGLRQDATVSGSLFDGVDCTENAGRPSMASWRLLAALDTLKGITGAGYENVQVHVTATADGDGELPAGAAWDDWYLGRGPWASALGLVRNDGATLANRGALPAWHPDHPSSWEMGTNGDGWPLTCWTASRLPWGPGQVCRTRVPAWRAWSGDLDPESVEPEVRPSMWPAQAQLYWRDVRYDCGDREEAARAIGVRESRVEPFCGAIPAMMRGHRFDLPVRAGGESLTTGSGGGRWSWELVMDAFELACATQLTPDVGGCAAEDADFDPGSLEGLRQVESRLECMGDRFELMLERLYVAGIPEELVDDLRYGVLSGLGERGAQGATVAELVAEIQKVVQSTMTVARQLRDVSLDVRRMESQIRVHGLQDELRTLEVMGAVNRAHDACSQGAGTFLGGVSDAEGGIFGSIGAAIRGASMCTSALVALGLEIGAIDIEGRIDSEVERQRYMDFAAQARARADRIGDSVIALNASFARIEGITAQLEAQRVAAQRTLHELALVQQQRELRHWGYDAAYDSLVATKEAEYHRALEAAKRHALLARIAVEEELGVNLTYVDGSDLGFLDASPAEWADTLCGLSGIDYRAIQERALAEATSERPAGVALPFDDQFIGEWVRKLRTFVEAYEVAYPSRTAEDRLVFSLTDVDVIDPYEERDVGRNLLLYTLRPMSTGWETQCTASHCVVASEAAGVDGPAEVFGDWQVEARALALERLPSASEGGTVLGRAAHLQRVELESASQHVFSWYEREDADPAVAVAIDASGTDVMRSMGAVPACRPAAPDGWRRCALFVFPPSEGPLLVGFEVLEGERALVAAPQLERYRGGASGTLDDYPTPFFPTDDDAVFGVNGGRTLLGVMERGREVYCPRDTGRACADRVADPTGLPQRCYRAVHFRLTPEDAEGGRHFASSSFPAGGFAYRMGALAVQLREAPGQDFLAGVTETARYSLLRRNPFFRNHRNVTHVSRLPVGRVQQARADARGGDVTTWRRLSRDPDTRAAIEELETDELAHYPLWGDYELRIYESCEDGAGVDSPVAIEQIGDVVLSLQTRYQVRQGAL